MRMRCEVLLLIVLVAAFVGLVAAMQTASAQGPAAPSPAPPAAAPAPAAAANAGGDSRPTLFVLLENGGPIMYPIYACSILMVAFAIERAVSLRRGKVLPPQVVASTRELVSGGTIDKDKLLGFCQAHPSPVARIFQAAVKRLHRPLPEIEKTIEDAGAKEVRLLRRNTRVLSGVGSIAPLLGLLGTVFGMIEAFTNISVGDALGKAELLASGIYQALVTTAAGLTVAIPSLVLYMIFTARIERLVGDMDDLSMDFVETLLKSEDPAAV